MALLMAAPFRITVFGSVIIAIEQLDGSRMIREGVLQHDTNVFTRKITKESVELWTVRSGENGICRAQGLSRHIGRKIWS